jgi:hypothetical protein
MHRAAQAIVIGVAILATWLVLSWIGGNQVAQSCRSGNQAACTILDRTGK